MRIKSPKSSFALRALAIAALLLGTSNMAALANPDDRVSFREFRQQNDGLDRNVVRRMYHQQFGRNAANGPLRTMPFNTPNVITVGADGIAVCGGPINNRITREPREARVRPMSMQQLANGGLTRVNRGVDLDLSSNSRNIVLGQGLFGTATGSSVDINLDGKNATYTAGSVVTAAEYVAVKQVLEGGGQQVQIDRAGRASGGTVDLSALTSGNSVMRASSLVVPTNVTTYGDFAKGSGFRLSGQLSNYGTVQVLSSDSSVRGGAIRANDISNHTGALISSTADLHLDATRNFTNYGDVLSTQGLTISAGGELKNAGRISSNNDLTINSSSVTNRGVISSNLANVNLASTGDIAVNNNRGTISAVNGAINVRDAAYTGVNNSYIISGDLVSKELNLNSGLGTANVAVNRLTGVINGTGSASHVLASTDMLNVGNVCLTGDPTFYNTSGGINIVDDVIVAEELAFIAAGSINVLDGVEIRAGDLTKGYNITFISGGSITASGGSSQSSVGPVTGLPPYANSGTVTVTTKAGKFGSGINFGVNTVVSSRSTDTANDRDGGDVSMFVFGKTGLINLRETKVETGGQNQGVNGDVLLVNGGTLKNTGSSIIPTILTAAIDTTNQGGGAQGGGGDLTIVTSAPVISGGKSVVYNEKGAVVGSAFLAPGTRLVKGDVILDNLGATETKLAGNINIQSGNSLQIYNKVTADTATFNSTFAQRTFDLDNANDPPTNLFTPGEVIADTVSVKTGRGGFIGTGLFDGMLLTTNTLNVDSPSGNASFVIHGSGSLTLNSKNSSVLVVNATESPVIGREIMGTATASSFALLRGGSFNASADISSKDLLSLQSVITNLENTDPTRYSAKNLVLSGPNVGTSATVPFEINPSVKRVDIAQSDNAAVHSNSTKGILLGLVNISASLLFSAESSISVGVASDIGIPEILSSDGLIDITTAAGTVAINKGVDIFGQNSVTIINSGVTSRDKLTFAAGATVTTNDPSGTAGDILLALGQPAPSASDSPNITVTETNGGVVAFFGTGVTSKGAGNSATADKAVILFSNSNSVRNFTLAGSNVITATSQ
jgi:adhesin HecA-like repeat protein